MAPLRNYKWQQWRPWHSCTKSDENLQGGPKKSKLLYFFHIFAKYWPIITIFPPIDSGRNLLLSDMHVTPIMSLHYLVKYKYPKMYNIYSRVVNFICIKEGLDVAIE